MMGQWISFNALGLVRTVKVVSREHLYGSLSVHRDLNGSPLLCRFRAAAGFEVRKTSPPANIDITILFCADSNGQYGRGDNICIFENEDMDEKDVYERVVEVVNDVGVTISKHDISVCHHLPSREPGSRQRSTDQLSRYEK